MEFTIGDALKSLRPDEKWSIFGDEIHWSTDNATTQPTDAELNAEIAKLHIEYDSQEYARKRKAEYDQLNQYEMMFDDKRDGTTTWVDKINEIKSRYPKG